MKRIANTLLFFVALTSFAQNDVVVQLEKFDELKVYNGLQVNLIKSDEHKVVITGERASEVTVKNKKGILKIALDLASTFNSKKAKIDLYYNSNIAELDANQGAVISSKEVFTQTQLKLSSQDGAYIKLNVAVDYLNVKGITGGNIQLKGNTKSQNVNMVSGANYEAANLISEQATIYVSTGAEVEVQVTEAMDAKVKFGGTILYSGRPKSVTTEKSLGGKITKAAPIKEETEQNTAVKEVEINEEI